MSTKGRAEPRTVCCAIPISRAAGKVLVITSRKRPNYWVCELPFAPLHSRTFFSLARTYSNFFSLPFRRGVLTLFWPFSFPSAQRWLRTLRWSARGCSFARSFRRRSHRFVNFFVSLLILVLPLFPSIVLYCTHSRLHYSIRLCSRCAWYDHPICHNSPVAFGHLSLLRT